MVFSRDKHNNASIALGIIGVSRQGVIIGAVLMQSRWLTKLAWPKIKYASCLIAWHPLQDFGGTAKTGC